MQDPPGTKAFHDPLKLDSDGRVDGGFVLIYGTGSFASWRIGPGLRGCAISHYQKPKHRFVSYEMFFKKKEYALRAPHPVLTLKELTKLAYAVPARK